MATILVLGVTAAVRLNGLSPEVMESLAPVPEPNLSVVESGVERQLRAERAALDERLADPSVSTADLAATFSGESYGAFSDLDRLTIFADNLVPHVLRQEGILIYDAELGSRIDAEVCLESGSPEEVEIRAGAVHAVECWVALLREAGVRTSPHELDTLLWTRGQQSEFKAIPRHRTRTTFY